MSSGSYRSLTAKAAARSAWSGCGPCTIDYWRTRIVPGSHRNRKFAEDGACYSDELAITGERGSALVFDAGLWHGGGANINGESRWALALGYARWFIKPAFDYMHNTPAEIYEMLSNDQKKLLGFDCVPPKDEFTRVRRRSPCFERPLHYQLPSEKLSQVKADGS